MEAAVSSGPDGATGTSRSAGSSAGTSASSTSSGTTTGCSATATAAPAWSSSPGRASNGTCRSRARHPPMTPPWPHTGPNGATKVKPPLDSYTLRLLTGQDGLCPLCGDHLLSADQPPQSPRSSGNGGGCSVTRKAIAASYLAHHGSPGTPHDDRTRLVHASCQRGQPSPPAQEPGSFNPRRPRGLLEPCAGTTRTHGSEEAGAQQCARRYPTGHHPLNAYCDNTGGEPLAWMLRKGSDLRQCVCGLS